jgi:hypothetical protein
LYVLEGLSKVPTNGAADTAAAHFDHSFAGTLDQQMIQPDFTELVDDNKGLAELRSLHQIIEYRRLPAAEKPGEDMDGYWFFWHNVFPVKN